MAWLYLIVALFSPLGHELVIWLGLREQKLKEPKYITPPNGVGVLAIESPSLASRIRLKSGDIVLSVNGKAVNSRNELLEQVKQTFFVVLEIKREDKILKITSKKYYDDELGIIFVPDGGSRRYLTVNQDSLLDVIKARWKKLDARRRA